MGDEVTFADFQSALKDIKSGAAPGSSRLTANVGKSWSDATQFLADKHMNNLWDEE
jgi:hypothetical protein